MLGFFACLLALGLIEGWCGVVVGVGTLKQKELIFRPALQLSYVFCLLSPCSNRLSFAFRILSLALL